MSGISNRIEDALEKIMRKDYEGAFVSTCIAVARTSKDAFPNLTDRERYIKFLDDNAELIMFAITNGKFRMTVMPKSHFPHPRIKSEDGSASLSEIIYVAIRCSLIHEAEMSKNVKFVEDITFSCKDNEITLPLTILDGLILVVVGAITNSKEYLSRNPCYKGKQINDYWGNKEKIKNTFFPIPPEILPHISKLKNHSKDVIDS